MKKLIPIILALLIAGSAYGADKSTFYKDLYCGPFVVTQANGNLSTTGTLGAGATTVTSLTDSGLTSGRVTFAGASGLLSDDAGLTYNSTTDILSLTGTTTGGIDLSTAKTGFSANEWILRLGANVTGTTEITGGYPSGFFRAGGASAQEVFNIVVNSVSASGATFMGGGGSGDAYRRVRMLIGTYGGGLLFGPGTTLRDTWLERFAQGRWLMSGALIIDNTGALTRITGEGTSGVAGNKVLLLKANSGQSANIIEIQDGDGNIKAGMTSNFHTFNYDNINTYWGTANDAKAVFTGTQLQIQSDLVTATDSLLLRGGTNGILFNIGATEQITLLDGSLSPKTTNDIDLGTSSLLYKNAYLTTVCSSAIKTDTTAVNDLTITTGAAKTLVLVTSVYDDLQFQVAYAKTNPANVAPSWETFTATTSEYAFSVDDEVDTAANELPHWWKEGTAGNAHLHITTKGVPAQEQKAQFTVTFAYAYTNEVWVEQALTAELTIPISTTALTNFYLDLGDLTFTNYLIGTQVKCRIKRVAKTAGGTEYAGDIFITQVGIHLSKDTMGSRAETTK